MSKIEWVAGDDGSAGKTWNPVTGCDKVSPGCKHCYAEGIADRFWAKQYPPVQDKLRPLGAGGVIPLRHRRFTDVQCHPDRLGRPLTWREPCRVFVNSMSDLFHDDVSNEFIAAVFGVMAECPRHTFQVLTKRPARMGDWFRWVSGRPFASSAHSIWHAAAFCVKQVVRLRIDLPPGHTPSWPLPNVWLGVSVEDQERADERIIDLRKAPAAVRFISAEPLLGKIDLIGLAFGKCAFCGHLGKGCFCQCPCRNGEHWQMIDWVICGGESGRGARPMDLAWARILRDQCDAAGVPFFLKQLGGAQHKRGGSLSVLDGVRHQEWPHE